MSCITEIVVIVEAQGQLVDDLQRIDLGIYRPQFLCEVEEGNWGGAKYPNHAVLLAAVNYAALDRLTDFLSKRAKPRNVCILVKSELDDGTGHETNENAGFRFVSWGHDDS